MYQPIDVVGRPRVTVVVPCYNYGRYLEACVASALSQPQVAVDVVIVDDASTDSSADVAERLAADEPRITVVRHPRNAGHIATYNDGLGRAERDYVVLLSADDQLTPGSLGRATALLESHPAVGFAYGDVACFSGDSLPAARTTARRWVVWPGRSWLGRRFHAGSNCIWSPEVVLRTSIMQRIGGYRAEFPHSGDLDMWMRAAALADVGYVQGADQAYYRFHGDNMHATSFKGGEPEGVLVDLLERRRTFEQLADDLSAGASLAAARRALAVEALKIVVRTDLAEHHRTLTEELMAFAAATDPGSPRHLWWRAAQRRRSAGPRWSARSPGTLAGVAVVGARDRVRRLRWESVGG